MGRRKGDAARREGKKSALALSRAMDKDHRRCSIMMWGRELSGGRRPGTSHLRVFRSSSPPDRSFSAGPADNGNRLLLAQQGAVAL